MLEMLLEALRELLDPTPNRPPPRRRTSHSGSAGSGPSGQPDNRPPEQSRETVTLEDVFRRVFTGEDEAGRAERHRADGPREPTRAPGRDAPARAERQSSRQSSRQARRAPVSREEMPETSRQYGPPRGRMAEKPLSLQETIARAEQQDALFLGETQQVDESAYGLEFVKNLRNNPNAVRDAFVYSEILGRPLAERDM